MTQFDILNAQTRYAKDHERVDHFRGNGLSPQEQIAMRNNETFRAHNGCYPDRPYGPSGYTYSTGRKY